MVSADDLRRLAALEAERSAAGCTDASCLAEIAGALGAERVLFGSLSRLGTTTTASLSLYTAKTGAIERASVDVVDVAGLAPALRALVGRLLGAKEVAAPAAAASPAYNPWFGVVVAGGVATVVGAGTALVSEVLIEDAARDGGDKEVVRVVGLVGVGVGVTGAGAAVVGLVAGGWE